MSAGEPLEIYLTDLTDGSVIPLQVAIGGRTAEILFVGKAPGFAGLNQVNVRVPSEVCAGTKRARAPDLPRRTTNEVSIGLH
jgi:uncharacterized protein (TIGR03437 family)